MATYTGSPQIAIRAHGSNKCSYHYGKEIIYYCEKCDDLACSDCVGGKHKGHNLEILGNVIPTARQKIQSYIKKLEQIEIPCLKEKLRSAEDTRGSNQKHYQKQISEIKDRNECLKKSRDEIAETLIKTLNDMEQQNSDELVNHMKELQSWIDKLTSQLKEFTGSIQSGSDVLMFDTSRVVPYVFEGTAAPICTIYEFTKRTPYLQELQQLFGALSIPVHDQTLSINQPGYWGEKSAFTPLKDNWVKSMHMTSKNQCWVCFVNSNSGKVIKKMLLVDQSGKVKKKLTFSVCVWDFYLSPLTGNIWFCSSQDKSVREVVADQSIVRFTTDATPYCICVTKDDHIIIGHDRQLVKYTRRGQKVVETPNGKSPEVITPFHLSECPLTSNIALVDWDVVEHGGNGKHFVLILNKKLQPLFTYNGEGHVPQSKAFGPQDVCYNNVGELAIADLDNKTVVSVSRTGKYLKTLYINNQLEPKVIGMHTGALWVSHSNGSVQVLKHS